ncbi:MAG: metallophosphoesterase family protein [Anaerolineae bacterium]|nr:metallophosphoesterase family protein [Anaerolineae bacterium]
MVALEAVMLEIQRLSGESLIDYIYCLGDVLFGHSGGDAVMNLLDRHHVQIIRGNHDDDLVPVEVLGEDKAGLILRVHDWMKANVSPANLELLAKAPIMETVRLEDGRRLCLFHSNPADLWDMVNGQDPDGADLIRVFGPIEAEVIAYGHYHREHVMSFNEKLLINVASVDSFVREVKDHFARFTLLTSLPDRLVIQRHAVAYDKRRQSRMNRALHSPFFFE